MNRCDFISTLAATARELYRAGGSVVRLLPAWPVGSFRGLRARGGLELDLEWQGGLATRVVMRASSEGEHKILLPTRQRANAVLFDGKAIQPSADGVVMLVV